MQRIIRAQLFQLGRSPLVYAVIAGLSVVLAMETGDMERIRDGAITGRDILLCGFLTVLCVTAFLAAYVQCRDRRDKTINQDLLSGAGRGHVFLGRYLSVLPVTAALLVLECLLPAAICTALNGWDDSGADRGAIRFVCMLLLLFRASAEVTLLAVLLPHTPAVCAASFLAGLLELLYVVENEAAACIRPLCTVGEFLWLSVPDEREQYLADGTVATVVSYQIPAAETAFTLVFSAAAGCFCLWLANRIFCKRDYD